jgi:hypothetical protein
VLAIARRIDSQIHRAARDLPHRDHISPFVLWAIDGKEINFPSVVANPSLPGIRLDALGAELDDSVSQSSCLALDPQKGLIRRDDEVVTLVDPDRNQDPVTATN